MTKAGANVITVGSGGLPHVSMTPSLLEPVAMLQSAYINIESLARLRRRDPDRPKLLNKVTETI
jgi:glutamine---fructose-6-phosphate transaminase (isomerizing)